MEVATLLKRDSADCFSTSACVQELVPQKFHDFMVWNRNGRDPVEHEIVIFYAPWCGRCQEMEGVFCATAHLVKFCSFGAFNCQKRCGHFQNIRADMPFLVKTFPTVIAFRHGMPVEEFQGKRDVPELIKFAMRLRTSTDD